MAFNFLLLLSVIIFAFSARLYSQVSSTLFQELYVKNFRNLTSSYWSGFFRSTLLSLLSFRNHGMNFVSLSFLNSGIIQNRQAMGLIMGSYLGVTLAAGIFFLSTPESLFGLCFVVLILSIFSSDSRFFRISKLFFNILLVLFGYAFLIMTLNQSLGLRVSSEFASYILDSSMGPYILSILLFLVFKNIFSIIGIFLSLKMSFWQNGENIFFPIALIFILNSIVYIWITKNSHRDTRRVAIMNLIIILVSSGLTVLLDAYQNLNFYLLILFFSILCGVLGYLLSMNFSFFEKWNSLARETESPRHITLYSSVYNYPGALLVEFYHQEYKKLFAHVNTTFELFIQKYMHSDVSEDAKVQKYMEISERISSELENLELQLHEVEKTKFQAEFLVLCQSRLSSMKSFIQALRFFNAHLPITTGENVDFFQKVHEMSSFYLMQLVEKDSIQSVSASGLMDVWTSYCRRIEDLKNRGLLETQQSSDLIVEAKRMIEAIQALS